MKVIIESGWSSLDGRAGVVVGQDEKGFVQVKVHGWQYPMSWRAAELRATE